jgi:hypothetical protein
LLAGGAGARSSTEIFKAVVKAIDFRSPLKSRKNATLRASIDYISSRGIEDEFLRSVTWTFGSESVSTLQARLETTLRETEGGNPAVATVLADKILCRIMQACGASDVELRTLQSSDLETVRSDARRNHLLWKEYDAMEAFTSWISWQADHYNIAVLKAPDGTWSSMVVGVNFVPSRDELLLHSVLSTAETDPAVGRSARSQLKMGDVVAAFSNDVVLRVRLLDALRTTTVAIYAVVVKGDITKQIAHDVLRGRVRRQDREVADVALNAAALEVILDPREKRVERNSTVQIMTVVARLLGGWLAEGDVDAKKMIVRWVGPRVKFLRDPDGRFHTSDSQVWLTDRSD